MPIVKLSFNKKIHSYIIHHITHIDTHSDTYVHAHTHIYYIFSALFSNSAKGEILIKTTFYFVLFHMFLIPVINLLKKKPLNYIYPHWSRIDTSFRRQTYLALRFQDTTEVLTHFFQFTLLSSHIFHFLFLRLPE